MPSYVDPTEIATVHYVSPDEVVAIQPPSGASDSLIPSSWEDEYNRLTSASNWGKLGAGALRGVTSLADILSMVSPAHLGSTAPSVSQDVADVIGTDRLNYGKGTPLGAVGEMIAANAIGPGGVASKAISLPLSSLGAGIGRREGGALGELVGALSPVPIELGKALLSKLSTIAEPQTVEALSLAERKGLLAPGTTESARSITPAMADRITAMNAHAQALPTYVAGELGAHGADNQFEKVLANQFDQGAQRVIDSKLFNTPADLPQLSEAITGRLGDINEARTATVGRLEDALNAIPQETLERSAVWKDTPNVVVSSTPDSRSLVEIAAQNPKPNVTKRVPVWKGGIPEEWQFTNTGETWNRLPISERYALEGGAPKKVEQLVPSAGGTTKLAGNKPGIIDAKSPEIVEAMSDLKGRIKDLRTAPFTEPITEGLQNTMDTMRDKLAKGVTPSEAVTMMQSLNEARRTLAKEFDTVMVAKKLGGNTPSVGSFEGSLEAIAKIQRAISKALESSVSSISEKAGITDIPADYFTELNKEYGALKATEDLVDKFGTDVKKGIATKAPTRIVQNPGSGVADLPQLPTPRKYLGGLLARALFGAETPYDKAFRQMQYIDAMSPNALKNIQSLISLNAAPAEIPTMAEQRLERLGRLLGSTATAPNAVAVYDYNRK